MDFSEKWGKDVDEAVKLALQDLNLTIDEVEVTVLEQASKGFLGLRSKLAKVRVEKKKPETIKKEAEQKAVQKREEKTKKPEAAVKAKSERTDTGRKTIEDHVTIAFVKEVIGKMDLNLKIYAYEEDEILYINIEGKEAGTVIGKRGQTLEALQYLTSLVANKGKDKYTRVVVDAEKYRKKRKKTLEQLANRLANKVYYTKKSIRLEPMNPYERKIIHSTLQNNEYVTTKSEGEEPYRRVKIELK